MTKTIAYQSSEIACLVEGEGHPVILLHGFAEDHSIWDQQVNHLKDHFRLIVPDLPGSGLSERIDDMSMEGLADCVRQIMDIECPHGPGSSGAGVILIGHSMGGYISLALAEKFADRLSGLGLFHSTAYSDSPEKKTIRIKSMEFIREFGAHAFIRQSTPNLFSEHFKKRYPEIVEALIAHHANFDPAALLSNYEAMINRPDRTGVLKSFPGRVLFVIGEQDPAVPLGDSLRQCHLPQLSHIHIFENTAHMGMLENPERSIRALTEFNNCILDTEG